MSYVSNIHFMTKYTILTSSQVILYQHRFIVSGSSFPQCLHFRESDFQRESPIATCISDRITHSVQEPQEK